MWKPGSPKPKLPDDHPPEERREEPNEGKAASKKSNLPIKNKKKLSGATMNMKFMKRKLEERNHESQFRKSLKRSESNVAMRMEDHDVVVVDDDDKNNNNNNNNNNTIMRMMTTTTQPQQMEAAAVLTIDSTCEMYGLIADVVGRRSFGGFNAAMEEAWKSSYDTLVEGKYSSGTNRKRDTDDDLLERYANIIRDRKGDRGGRGGQRSRSRGPRDGGKRKRR